MKRWLIVLGVFIALCVLAYPFAKQTFPIEMIRSAIRNVPAAQLWADDLADDVRNKARLAPLQEWSVQTLARYSAGQLATNGESAFRRPFSVRSVRLTPQEVPNWLREGWSEGSPEVSILLSDSKISIDSKQLNLSKEPECIVVGWYLCGLMVGPPDYVTTFRPWYIVKVKPGIYAYSLER